MDDTRLPLTTPDPLAERAERLRELIPEAFVEGRVDFDRLRQALGELVDEGRERYGLSWAGKADAIRAIQAPSVGTLVPCPEESVNFDTTENLFIEGDNLEVLKLLQRSYHGQVKMIYIDPPYNTGGEFIYPDNFREGLEEYLKYSGQVGEGNVRLSTNTETSGRYHSKWLDMMYPRLFLARNLLKEDGVIFVSIDDHEVHNLRLLMDEVFGAENFIAHIVWQKRYVSNVTAKYLSDMHDHILLYARHAESVSIARLPRTDEQRAAYKNPDDDPRGPWRAQDLSASKTYKAGLFSIVTPTGRTVEPPPGRYWRCNREQYEAWIRDGRIWFGVSGDGRPMLKAYLSAAEENGLTPNTWWSHKFAGHNKEATLEVKELFGGWSPFDTPKPVKLIDRMLELCCPTGDELVLDFFAGSGTTGQAVISRNLADGGQRRFIMVQLPEPVAENSTAAQHGFTKIVDVARARIEKVIEKSELRRDGTLQFERDIKPVPVGFRTFRLTSSNFKIWNSAEAAESLDQQLRLFADHVLPDRSEQDILYELILKSGLECSLTAKVETKTVAGQTAHSIADGLLVICLANPLTQDCLRALIDLTPERIICLDAAFGGNDQLKTNTVLEMKSHNIEFRTV